MTEPSNPPAFPGMYGTVYEDQKGMDLRDYFASLAMVGVWQDIGTINDAVVWLKRTSELAIISYQIADAMLAEREKFSTSK